MLPNKAKKVSDLPENQRTKIWNIQNNTISEIAITRYDMLMKGAQKIIKTGTGHWPDWTKENYRLDEFKGQPYRMYHVKSDKWIDFMTVDLFLEIKKRNPVESNLKDNDGNPYEHWKNFLSTKSEVIEAIKNNQTPEQLRINALEKQLEAMNKILEKINVPDFDPSNLTDKPKKESPESTSRKSNRPSTETEKSIDLPEEPEPADGLPNDLDQGESEEEIEETKTTKSKPKTKRVPKK